MLKQRLLNNEHSTIPRSIYLSFGSLMFVMNLTTEAKADPWNTYYIDESTDFTGNGCPNTDLNDITSSLKSRMDQKGWSGHRYVNNSAWPSDFKEKSLSPPGGLWNDKSWGDNYSVSVYAGHGWMNYLQFGYENNASCGVTISDQMRLCILDGADSSVMMYLTSCTGKLTHYASTIYKSKSAQHLAYNNSPAIYDNQPRDFFDATVFTLGDPGVRTRVAWLNEMDNRPGAGWNSPVIYTRHHQQVWAQHNHYESQLALGTAPHAGSGDCAQPYLYHYLHIRNNGCGGCGAGC